MSDDFDITSPTSPCVSEYAPKRKAPKATKPKPKPRSPARPSAAHPTSRLPPPTATREPALAEPTSPESCTRSEVEHFADTIAACGLALESAGVSVHWRGAVAAVRSRQRTAIRDAYEDAKAIEREPYDFPEPKTPDGWVVQSIKDRFHKNVKRLTGYAMGWSSFDNLWIWLRIETAAINAFVAALTTTGKKP